MLRQYTVTVKHDNGRIKFITFASSEQHARDNVIAAELCPDSAIVKVRCNRWRYLYVLQGFCGSWEDLTAAYYRKEIAADLKAYRANEGGLYRIVTRRELNA